MSDFLNSQEKYTFKALFKIADAEQKSFLGKEEGIAFFSKAGIPHEFLIEIWQTADKDNKEYITEEEFYVALKLIACAQHGIESDDHILSTQVPLPQFSGIAINEEITSSITENEREEYIKIFKSCNLVNGLLFGSEGSDFFIKSKLPMNVLNLIWQLADTRNSGTLNQTEFIIAMHYISRISSNPAFVLPKTLPSQTYAEATGKFATSIRRHKTTMVSSPVMRNSTPIAGIRSPVIRNNSTLTGFHSPVVSHTTTSMGFHSPSISYSPQVVVSLEEIEKYKPYFYQLDTDSSGFIEAEEAVYFFSHSRLPDSELGVIWEIADSNHLGKLNLNDFCVAMHLINMRKNNESIDQYINSMATASHYSPSSPVIPNQHLLNQRYELENQLVEIKQQVISEQKLIDKIGFELEQVKRSNEELETRVIKAKDELHTTKTLAEDKENELKAEKRKRNELLGLVESTPTPSFVTSLPELTRATSTFSGVSSISTPRPTNTVNLFDPTPKIVSMSPLQAKAVSKYGFDITAFDTLSSDQKQVETSVNDDLASLFISNNTHTNNNNNFDDIFMK